jgi:hypothetical protein
LAGGKKKSHDPLLSSGGAIAPHQLFFGILLSEMHDLPYYKREAGPKKVPKKEILPSKEISPLGPNREFFLPTCTPLCL